MRLPALLFFTALTFIPAIASAQVVIQDQAETFIDDRNRHLQRMEQNPEKWWGGNVSDRPASTTLYDPHEFSATPAVLGMAGSGNPANPATMIPGNPETVQPYFSFDELNEATQPTDGGETSLDLSNPTDIEQAAQRAGQGVLQVFGDVVGGDPRLKPRDDLPQPNPAAAPQPAMVEQAPPPLTAARPKFVPADPQMPSPPPVQDEAGAIAINPADAPASADTLAPEPASLTTTAIPALEDTAAPTGAQPNMEKGVRAISP